jgi:hypothetical protein
VHLDLPEPPVGLWWLSSARIYWPRDFLAAEDLPAA